MPFRLIAPPFTPMLANGELNLNAVQQQAELLSDSQIDGVFVAGSTGEGMSLTSDERQQLAQTWVTAGQHFGLEVIIQVGHTCQLDAIQLARHAAEIGADAVSSPAPSYFKPANVDDLVDFLEPIANAAGHLPFYYYDIPMLTGVTLPMVEFLQTAATRIDNLAGLKYTNDDLVQLLRCLETYQGTLQVLFGRDQMLLPAYSLGVAGAVGSTYNLMGPLYREMLAAFDAGDHSAARRLQAKSIALIELLERHGFLAAAKYAMSRVGPDCGPVRSPLRNLTDRQRAEIDQRLAELKLPIS